jgi:DNA-binding transcriptional ArsR family regulator
MIVLYNRRMPVPSPLTPDVFHAIASPVRRALLDQLSSRDRTVRSLAAPFDMTLPAVSQQLRVLRGAGLVTVRRVGRWRVYHLNAAPLRDVSQWLHGYERLWTAQLKALGEDLTKYAREERWR